MPNKPKTTKSVISKKNWEQEYQKPRSYHGGKVSRVLDTFLETIMSEVEFLKTSTKAPEDSDRLEKLISLGIQTSKALMALHGLDRNKKEQPGPKEIKDPVVSDALKTIALKAARKPHVATSPPTLPSPLPSDPKAN